jgi:hypothetical protein
MRTITALPRGPLSGGIRKAVNKVLSEVEILDNAVVFPENVEADYGTFKASSSVLIGLKTGGRWSGTYLSGWFFSTLRKFLPRENVLSSELPIKPSVYRVEIDVPGSGILELPGYRLKNGVLLLYITPNYEFNFPSDVIDAGGLEDYAQLSIMPLENGFKGELRTSLKSAEYVAISLKGKLVEDLLFFGGNPGSFTYSFIGDPTLVISHEKVLSPQGLQKEMGGFAGLSGYGDFELKLKVGKSRKTMSFMVGLKNE